MKKSLASFFHDFDFFLGQFVEFIDEFVDLIVGGVNLALQDGLVMTGFRLNQLLV